jgi:hypothetical protein
MGPAMVAAAAVLLILLWPCRSLMRRLAAAA